MKENTEKLRKAAAEKLQPFIQSLIDEGMDSYEIMRHGKSLIQSMVNNLYRNHDPHQATAAECVHQAMDTLKGRHEADSKAENILYRLLCESKIPFEFQYPIGAYRVDYLVGDSLIVELDGPHHNKEKDSDREAYLRRMGYFILRVPIWILAIDRKAVIEEIKECLPKEITKNKPDRPSAQAGSDLDIDF